MENDLSTSTEVMGANLKSERFSAVTPAGSSAVSPSNDFEISS